MIISIANQKGGVSKTTTALNLGVALNELGYSVLLIDMDPQGSLTLSMGIEPAYLEQTIYDVLIGKIDINNIIHGGESVNIAPANIDLSAAEVELLSEIGRESILLEVLEGIRDKYKYIIIDCPPSLGLLTINALTACDGVIAPVAPDFLALKGLVQLTNTIKKVKKLNPKLDFIGVLISMYDKRTLHDKEAISIIKENYNVFDTYIRRAVAIKDSSIAGQSMLEYAPYHDVSNAYRRLAKEVLKWEKDQI
jgi:chromosome partitioning protein